MSRSLKSDVALEFGHSDGRTKILRRKAGGLCHLGKPYFERDVMTLQLVNPTAGLFSGDSLRMDISLREDSQVALTSPSAARYHTMESGLSTVKQDFLLEDGAWLDWWPEMVIPQRKSDSVLETDVRLEGSAEMVFLDLLAPGRIAFGENVEFRKFETRFDLFRDGQLQVRERCVIEPARSLWPLEMPGWETCYYGVLWIASPLASEAVAAVREELWLAGSALEPDLAVVRFLAPDSVQLRRMANDLRRDLQKVLPRLATDFRKL